jgi:acyl carrier protein
VQADEVSTPTRMTMLIEIWQRVVGDATMTADSDLFEHGGSSLEALEIAAEVYERLGVEVTLREVFDRSSPRSMSDFLDTYEVSQ